MVSLIEKDWKDKGECSIVDIGTGSGCIAISLAMRLPNAELWATDVSQAVLTVAKRNAERHGVRVNFLCSDALLGRLPIEKPLDVIVSNPPYILEKEKETMEQNVLAYEPHLALFVPNDDPLLFYRCIARMAMGALKPKGMLFFEINEAYAAEMLTLLEGEGFKNAVSIQDFYGKDRIIKASK